jgi:hypothetical protein
LLTIIVLGFLATTRAICAKVASAVPRERASVRLDRHNGPASGCRDCAFDRAFDQSSDKHKTIAKGTESYGGAGGLAGSLCVSNSFGHHIFCRDAHSPAFGLVAIRCSYPNRFKAALQRDLAFSALEKSG